MKNFQATLKNDVKEYQFTDLLEENDPKAGEENKYQFEELKFDKPLDDEEHQKKINLERECAERKSFNIAQIVREHRGIDHQARQHQKMLIEKEVKNRLVTIEEQAFKKGYDDGLKKSQQEIAEQTKNAIEEKSNTLLNLIDELSKFKQEILSVEKNSLYALIRDLVKWVTLKELQDDGKYIYRLLDKLSGEIKSKNNVVVKVDKKKLEKKSRHPRILAKIPRQYQQCSC